MKPDFLIDRKQAMTILEIRNANVFKQKWSNGLLPAPVGAKGTSLLWCGTLVREVKKMMDDDIKITREVVADLTLDAVIRLIEDKSMKIA